MRPHARIDSLSFLFCLLGSSAGHGAARILLRCGAARIVHGRDVASPGRARSMRWSWTVADFASASAAPCEDRGIKCGQEHAMDGWSWTDATRENRREG